LERRIRCTPGSSYINQLEWGNPVRENGVGTGAWLITATDCDENERRIAELRGQIEHKERFLGLLAQEMRGPLGPMTNALRVLQEHGNEPAVVRRSYATLARQVAQLVRFTEDLFDLARSRDLFTGVLLELDSVIAAAAQACAAEIAGQGQSFTVGGATGVVLRGDAGRLTQVFSHLLLNAAQLGNPGGEVVVRTEVEPDWVLVKVRDSGRGIEPAAGGGAGLGLTLVRHLVELHGGAVSVHSEGAGLGSEFEVRLPAVRR
jgi:signal transduction histidine kinase